VAAFAGRERVVVVMWSERGAQAREKRCGKSQVTVSLVIRERK
jgi:hypothetical protein